MGRRFVVAADRERLIMVPERALAARAIARLRDTQLRLGDERRRLGSGVRPYDIKA